MNPTDPHAAYRRPESTPARRSVEEPPAPVESPVRSSESVTAVLDTQSAPTPQKPLERPQRDSGPSCGVSPATRPRHAVMDDDPVTEEVVEPSPVPTPSGPRHASPVEPSHPKHSLPEPDATPDTTHDNMVTPSTSLSHDDIVQEKKESEPEPTKGTINTKNLLSAIGLGILAATFFVLSYVLYWTKGSHGVATLWIVAGLANTIAAAYYIKDIKQEDKD